MANAGNLLAATKAPRQNAKSWGGGGGVIVTFGVDQAIITG